MEEKAEGATSIPIFLEFYTKKTVNFQGEEDL